MMRRYGFGLVIGTLFVSLAACTVSTSKSDEGSSGGSSGSSSADGGSSGNPDGGGSSSGDGGAKVTPSNIDANVEINNACPAFSACGGSPSGTYDYTGGCVGDVFAQARAQCPTLDSSGIKVHVRGSLSFLSGDSLVREGNARVFGNIVFPAACAAGQCAAIEQGLKDGGFKAATCSAAGGGCNCAVDKSDSTENATTYKVIGNTIKTADGDEYEFCATATGFSYKGKSTGAEEGNWTLKKR